MLHLGGVVSLVCCWCPIWVNNCSLIPRKSHNSGSVYCFPGLAPFQHPDVTDGKSRATQSLTPAWPCSPLELSQARVCWSHRDHQGGVKHRISGWVNRWLVENEWIRVPNRWCFSFTLLYPKIFYLYFYIFLLYLLGEEGSCVCIYKSQRATGGSWLSLSPMFVPGTNLRLSHLTHSIWSPKERYKVLRSFHGIIFLFKYS